MVRRPTLTLLALLGACQAAAPAAEAPVREGLNESYLDEGLDLDEWVGRFETESREIFARRDAIVAALDLEAGDHVADVGAGTGLFLAPLAAAVSKEGSVTAVDISPRFVEHLRERARGADHVRVVLGTETDPRLEANSLDLVFTCDTYHHFTYPRTTLEHLHRALRPGGVLVIVDFIRIEGVSRDWVLGHVRAGQDEVRAEVEEAGFAFLDEIDVGLEENYLMRFVR